MNNETINLTTLICDSINSIFSKIFSSIDNSIYSNLDNIFFIDSNICNNSIFDDNSSNGFLILANSLILGIVLFYIINFSLSHLIYSKIDSPYQFLFKCIIFIAFTNSSFWICKQLINIISLITNYILELGFLSNGFEINYFSLIKHFNTTIYSNTYIFDFFTIDGILKIIFSLIMIYIFILYTIRFIMCKLLILLSPFAFLSLINNKTDGFFKGWLYYFLSLLFTQILIAIILVLSFFLEISLNDLQSKFIFLSVFAIIAKCQQNSLNMLKFIYQYSKNSLSEKFN